ncbi:osteoclast-stimulating factor 1-like isoform X1 [Amphibalanus amphitrite]|uniref:osteoclast-stimulating factor 1-like isoform X1 n=1 Tax=Amphibalanus amphitrite TaxID=1232801 RepID=UPI001C910238|nr:osteoclast-stimulating factor 1-like isoform X1 [Amphibalanus amphitrite]
MSTFDASNVKMALRAAPPPPKLAPKPGSVKVYRAIYKYTAQSEDELSFEAGDLLYVKEPSADQVWWTASCGTKTGLVPYNYVEERSEPLESPLHEAAKRGHLSFLQDCLRHRVSVNGLDKAGNTALHWAARGGHLECAEALLAVPTVCVNVQNKLGDTALHLAAWRGQAEMVSLLLRHGADQSVCNGQQQRPADLAQSASCAALLRPRSCTDDDYGVESDSD